MTLEVQRYLRDGGTLDLLAETRAISAKRHGEHPNLVLLKYNQIESPFADPIVRECRGLVLDEADGWRVVSRALDKFFNHGEGHAATIDWSTARVQEKVDGSLCVLYPYAGEWHVATTGTPDASGDVNGFGKTFAELFWETLDGGRLPSPDHGFCFFFELTSPLNRVVVRHEAASLTVLGGRHLPTQRELESGRAALMLDMQPVREFPLRSFEQIARSFEALDPLRQEGYVVVDAAFRRVKVKHPGYVALHHAKGCISRRAFVEIARAGETSEVEVAFPEFAPMLQETRSRLVDLVTEVEADLARLRGIQEQKAFALEANKTRCSSALFQVRAGKVGDVRAFFRGMHIDSLMRLLGYRTDEGIPSDGGAP